MERRARDFLRDAAGDRQDATIAASRGSSRCRTTRASASACGRSRRWPSCTAPKACGSTSPAATRRSIRHCQRSPLWKAVEREEIGHGSHRKSSDFPHYRSSAGRAVVSFEYVGAEQLPRRSRNSMHCLLNCNCRDRPANRRDLHDARIDIPRLSDDQKDQICGILSVGCDRETAADLLGCSLATFVARCCATQISPPKSAAPRRQSN